MNVSVFRSESANAINRSLHSEESYSSNASAHLLASLPMPIYGERGVQRSTVSAAGAQRNKDGVAILDDSPYSYIYTMWL